MKTMSDYQDLYLKTDALLLSDVFENFVNICPEYYRLDTCHYFSSLGLNWDAMFKMNGIKFKRYNKVNDNTWNDMMIVNQVNTLITLTQNIYMVGQ